ncbi:hypothetical protein GCM10023333_20810 [Ferrimonas pelagia]|uniref:Transposase n=1 Tax=Ferrimonas pelagia TaxID=1177826 RepID=A0ABP9EU09_9GAMM
MDSARKLKSITHKHTLTLENGGAYVGHEEVAKAVNIDVYFADPYASHQSPGT